MSVENVKIVGVLNTTPDSFSDGGKYIETPLAVERAAELFKSGADMIDIGAESTNPVKTEAPLTDEQEIDRLMPLLEVLMPKYPGLISIDSHHPETIQAIVDTFGPDFIANDVTGMNNPVMREVVAKNKLPCIISHLPARFGVDIQAAHKLATMDRSSEVLDELLIRRAELLNLGLEPSKISLDPGIGFGKTMRLNWELVPFAKLVHDISPDIQVMVGFSRKRLLLHYISGLMIPQFEADPRSPEATTYRNSKEQNRFAAQIAIKSGVSMIRVHDPEFYTDLVTA